MHRKVVDERIAEKMMKISDAVPFQEAVSASRSAGARVDSAAACGCSEEVAVRASNEPTRGSEVSSWTTRAAMCDGR